jgi:hypothetical protein
MSFFKKRYRVAMVLLFVGLACGRIQAQETPAADVAGGYSLLVVTHGYTLTFMGGSGSVAVNVNKWLGVVGDFGAYTVTNGSLSGLNSQSYTFGPRFSYRHWPSLVPFGQVLLGGAHATSVQSGFTGVTNSFAFSAGGAADFGLGKSGKFALRPQVEYFGFRGNGNTTGAIRFSIGVVFRIGNK